MKRKISPAVQTEQIDYDAFIGAYDLHSYYARFDWHQAGGYPLADAETRLRCWRQWATEHQKPLFLSEVGSMIYGWGGSNPGPASFEAAIKGAVFGKEMKSAEEENRISAVPWDPSSEVWTGWDLGIGDATAIWFVQQVGREPHVIDFYMARGASIDHYVKILKDKPSNYGRHLLPHDADKTELGSGQSIIEQLKGMGIRNTRVVKKLSIHERIEIGRRFLRRCWFDRKRCNEGIEALKMYRYEYDALAGVNSKKPIHNWASHPADAFTYLAVGFKPESMHAAPIQYPNLAIP